MNVLMLSFIFFVLFLNLVLKVLFLFYLKLGFEDFGYFFNVNYFLVFILFLEFVEVKNIIIKFGFIGVLDKLLGVIVLLG